MTGKIKRILKKRLFTRCLYSGQINGLEYRVIESKSALPFFRSTRSLAFLSEKDRRSYIQSMVYLDPKYHLQPSMMTPQKVLGVWGKTAGLGNLLVLGCAGCAIPRYISLEFPECSTKGIEHSREIIDIAKQFFITDEMKERLDIEEADAFEYVRTHSGADNEKYDAAFVDLFDCERIPQDVYSPEFLKDIYAVGKETSLAVFNMLNEENDAIVNFAKTADRFYMRLLISEGRRKTLVLIKNEPESNIDGLIDIIKNSWETIEI